MAFVVKLGDSFDFDDGRLPASIGSDPLASTLTVARACDRVVAVALFAASSRSTMPQVLAVGSIAQPTSPAGGALPGGSSRSLDQATLFSMSVESSDGAQVVSLSGELDIAYRDELEAALASAARTGTDVVVDLARLDFIDAGGLSALVAARKLVTSCGRRLRVRGARGIVRRVFDICRLDHLLDH